MPDELPRRGVLQLGLAGGLAALPARAAARPAPPDPGRKVGFAVVGLGKLSLGQILPGFAHARHAAPVALVSGHRDKAAKVAAKYGIGERAIFSYADFDRIADDPRIEVVYIVLPNFMHAEYTIRALKAGKHVLCEKPMATRVADAEAMIAAAAAADRRLMIAYRCHYDAFNLDVMRRMRSGALGRPRIVATDMGRQADPSDPSDAWRLDARQAGDGALADMGVYGVNAARYLLNEEPVEVRAWAHSDRDDPRFRTIDEVLAWQFRFPSGAVSNGSTSFGYAATMGYRVWGADGRLVADPACFYAGNRLSIGAREGPLRSVPALAPTDQFAREIDWMALVVQGQAPLVSPGAEGLQDMRLMEAITQAARSGGSVRTDWGYHRAFDPAHAVGDQLS